MPAADDYDLCTDIPRGEWGFNGLIMTDWGDVYKRQVFAVFTFWINSLFISNALRLDVNIVAINIAEINDNKNFLILFIITSFSCLL